MIITLQSGAEGSNMHLSLYQNTSTSEKQMLVVYMKVYMLLLE